MIGYFPSESGAAVDAHVLTANRAAFVAFATSEAAEAHLASLNGTLRPPGSALPVTLRRVVVDVGSRCARREGVAAPPAGVWPPVPRPGPQYGEPSPKIYIGSIPALYDEADVRAIFSTVGAVKDIKILRQPDGRHKGSGFVTYHDVAATERAIHFIDGRYVLHAPDFPSQKPIYMKYASMGEAAGARAAGTRRVSAPPRGWARWAPWARRAGRTRDTPDTTSNTRRNTRRRRISTRITGRVRGAGRVRGGAGRVRGGALGAYAGAQGAYAGAQGAYAGAQGAHAGAQGAYAGAQGAYAQQQQGAARRGVAAAAAAAAGVLSPAATVSDGNASSDVQDEKISHTTH